MGVSLLREVGIGASRGGRPPILLEFNADYGTLVGVDIGSRTLRFALADLQGHVLARTTNGRVQIPVPPRSIRCWPASRPCSAEGDVIRVSSCHRNPRPA